MRGKDLLKGINGIDEKLIEEALIDDTLIDDTLIEDTLIEDILIEDRLIEDILIEDTVTVHGIISWKYFERWCLPGIVAASLIIAAIFGATFFNNGERGSIAMPEVSVEETVEESISEVIIENCIPILSNERLVVWTEEKIIYIINRTGQVEDKIEGAFLADEKAAFGGKVIQEDTKLNILCEQAEQSSYETFSEKEESSVNNTKIYITKEEFQIRNPQLSLQESDIFIKSVHKESGNYLIGVQTEEGEEYYLCDKDFQVIKNDLTGMNAMKEYPAGLLVFEDTQAGSFPWYLTNLSKNQLTLKSVWENKVINTIFPFEETEYLVIERIEGNGNPVCIHGEWKDRRCSIFLINYELVDKIENGRFRLEVLNNQAIRLIETLDDFGTQTVKTFSIYKDGQWILNKEGESFYWINHIFHIRKNAEGLFAETNDGTTSIKIEVYDRSKR